MENHKFGDQPQIDFCYECRKDTEYRVEKATITKEVNSVVFPFTYTTAVCTECGKEMSPPGLIDKNITEFEQQCKQYGIPLNYQVHNDKKVDWYNTDDKAVDPSGIVDHID